MKIGITETERAALEVLRKTGIDVLEAALVAKEALQRGRGRAQRRPWHPDTCRHTFATYHSALYRIFPALQLEMGHRDSELLRTRYIYAKKDAETAAMQFFGR